MPAPSPSHARDPALVALGAAIRARRREIGLSQEDLAHLSQVDRSYMSSLERGTQNAGVLVVQRVAKASELTLAALFERAGL